MLPCQLFSFFIFRFSFRFAIDDAMPLCHYCRHWCCFSLRWLITLFSLSIDFFSFLRWFLLIRYAFAFRFRRFRFRHTSIAFFSPDAMVFADAIFDADYFLLPATLSSIIFWLISFRFQYFQIIFFSYFSFSPFFQFRCRYHAGCCRCYWLFFFLSSFFHSIQRSHTLLFNTSPHTHVTAWFLSFMLSRLPFRQLLFFTFHFHIDVFADYAADISVFAFSDYFRFHFADFRFHIFFSFR